MVSLSAQLRGTNKGFRVTGNKKVTVSNSKHKGESGTYKRSSSGSTVRVSSSNVDPNAKTSNYIYNEETQKYDNVTDKEIQEYREVRKVENQKNQTEPITNLGVFSKEQQYAATHSFLVPEQVKIKPVRNQAGEIAGFEDPVAKQSYAIQNTITESKLKELNKTRVARALLAEPLPTETEPNKFGGSMLSAAKPRTKLQKVKHYVDTKFAQILSRGSHQNTKEMLDYGSGLVTTGFDKMNTAARPYTSKIINTLFDEDFLNGKTSAGFENPAFAGTIGVLRGAITETRDKPASIGATAAGGYVAGAVVGALGAGAATVAGHGFASAYAGMTSYKVMTTPGDINQKAEVVGRELPHFAAASYGASMGARTTQNIDLVGKIKTKYKIYKFNKAEAKWNKQRTDPGWEYHSPKRSMIDPQTGEGISISSVHPQTNLYGQPISNAKIKWLNSKLQDLRVTTDNFAGINVRNSHQTTLINPKTTFNNLQTGQVNVIPQNKNLPVLVTESGKSILQLPPRYGLKTGYPDRPVSVRDATNLLNSPISIKYLNTQTTLQNFGFSNPVKPKIIRLNRQDTITQIYGHMKNAPGNAARASPVSVAVTQQTSKNVVPDIMSGQKLTQPKVRQQYAATSTSKTVAQPQPPARMMFANMPKSNALAGPKLPNAMALGIIPSQQGKVIDKIMSNNQNALLGNNASMSNTIASATAISSKQNQNVNMGFMGAMDTGIKTIQEPVADQKMDYWPTDIVSSKPYEPRRPNNNKPRKKDQIKEEMIMTGFGFDNQRNTGKKTKKVTGYNVYVKENKRKVKVNSRPLPRSQADALARDVTGNSLADSYKLSKTNKKVPNSRRKRFAIGQPAPKNHFKKGKNGYLVEKEQYRINSYGEKAGLSASKIIKNKGGINGFYGYF